MLAWLLLEHLLWYDQAKHVLWRCMPVRQLRCRQSLLPWCTPAHATCPPAPCCRSETYQYFNLPFCHPKEGKEYKPEGLGEVLEGDRLVSTPYKIK